jgi:RNA polymerase sigma-70 factor (ECF subfamily)
MRVQDKAAGYKPARRMQGSSEFCKTGQLNSDISEAITKYSDMVFRLAYSYMKNKDDAEDVFQDVFVSFMQYKGGFNDETHVKAWFIRTTVNRCKNIFKSAWFRMNCELKDDIAAKVAEEDAVLYEVLELPRKYREIIQLYYYEDIKLAEIAEILQISEGTAKTRLHRARKMLEVKLGGKADVR